MVALFKSQPIAARLSEKAFAGVHKPYVWCGRIEGYTLNGLCYIGDVTRPSFLGVECNNPSGIVALRPLANK